MSHRKRPSSADDNTLHANGACVIVDMHTCITSALHEPKTTQTVDQRGERTDTTGVGVQDRTTAGASSALAVV